MYMKITKYPHYNKVWPTSINKGVQTLPFSSHPLGQHNYPDDPPPLEKHLDPHLNVVLKLGFYFYWYALFVCGKAHFAHHVFHTNTNFSFTVESTIKAHYKWRVTLMENFQFTDYLLADSWLDF